MKRVKIRLSPFEGNIRSSQAIATVSLSCLGFKRQLSSNRTALGSLPENPPPCKMRNINHSEAADLENCMRSCRNLHLRLSPVSSLPRELLFQRLVSYEFLKRVKGQPTHGHPGKFANVHLSCEPCVPSIPRSSSPVASGPTFLSMKHCDARTF